MKPNSLAWIAVALAVILFTAEGYAIQQTRHAVEIAHQVQCSRKHSLQRQVKETEQFLRHHPGGALGFSHGQILKDLHDDQLQLAALGIVRC